MIRKIAALALFFLATSIFADVKTYQKYEDAQKDAQKENKIIALTIVSTNCPWCHKLLAETIKDKKVEAILNKDFVYVVINKDVRGIPNGLSARMVPTTFFLDKSGQKLTPPAIGYWDAENFESYLMDALKKAKKL